MGVYNGIPATELQGVRWQRTRTGDGGRGNHVEMATLEDGRVALRNAADPEGPALVYTRAEIEALIQGAKDGDFDNLLEPEAG